MSTEPIRAFASLPADALCLTLERSGEPRDLRDSALIAVMSDALLRISEVAALTVDDVEFRDDGSGLVHIRRSKTDQEAEGARYSRRTEASRFAVAKLRHGA